MLKKFFTKENFKKIKEDYSLPIIVTIVILAILSLTYCLYSPNSSEKNITKVYTPTIDEKNFKDEYNTIKDSKVVYLQLSEVTDIINNKQDSIILFCYKENNRCQQIVPTIMETAKKNNVKKIYYINLRESDEASDLRTKYTLKKNKAVISRAGSEDYNNLLDSLQDYLDDYILYTSKNKKVKTGTKRLYAPTLITIKDGNITLYQDTKEGKELTEEETNTMTETIQKMIEDYQTK